MNPPLHVLLKVPLKVLVVVPAKYHKKSLIGPMNSRVRKISVNSISTWIDLELILKNL